MKRALRVYVASPYWHIKKVVRQNRAAIVTRDVFMNMHLFPPEVVTFYSPIVYTRGIENSKPKLDQDYWDVVARETLPMYDALLAVKYAGHEESAGMAHEMQLAKGMDMLQQDVWPSEFYDYEYMENLVKHWRTCF